MRDGYFVHFINLDIKLTRRHIIFVLDSSNSVNEQITEAMTTILRELDETDTFHIIEMNKYAYVWNIETGSSVKFPDVDGDYSDDFPVEVMIIVYFLIYHFFLFFF